MGKAIPKDRLLSEIERLAELLGHPPSRTDMETYGGFSIRAYENSFDSWSNALKEAGFSSNSSKTNSVPPDLVLEDYERMAKELGRPPTPKDVEEHGKYSLTTYQTKFGTWTEMVDTSTVDRWEMPVGKDHPAWKGGHDDYYGPNWPKQRARRLELDDYQCQICGMDSDEHNEAHQTDLHVHHIVQAKKFDDYDKQNAIENLITLCLDCHTRWEGINLRPVF